MVCVCTLKYVHVCAHCACMYIRMHACVCEITCTSACICVCMCVCVCVCVYLRTLKDNLGVGPLVFSPLSLSQGLLLAWNLAKQTQLLSKFQGIHACLPSPGILSVYHSTCFYMGSRDLNTGPSTLPPELVFPSPRVWIIKEHLLIHKEINWGGNRKY